MKILVNPFNSEMGRIGMRVSRNSCSPRLSNGGRHAVRKFRRTVTMKITIEGSNIEMVFEGLKTVR